MTEIVVNRAPLLTLWASVVAQRLGHPTDTALTLGRAVAGQTAAAKGKRLGILEARLSAERERIQTHRDAMGAESVRFMGRTISCLRTPQGLRALADAHPMDPDSVRRYLATKFKDALALVEGKLTALAAAYSPDELEARAMDLYMAMRPVVGPGKMGWGKAGRLEIERIDQLLARRA